MEHHTEPHWKGSWERTYLGGWRRIDNTQKKESSEVRFFLIAVIIIIFALIGWGISLIT